MRKQQPGGGGGGVEIRISAQDINAAGLIEKTQKGLSEVGKSAVTSTAAIAGMAKVILEISGGPVLNAVTKVGSAIGAVSSAISGIYNVSQIPLVSQQLQVLYQAGIEATKELAPLSEVLKDIGESSVYLGENFLGKGVFSDIASRLKPLQESVAKIFSSGIGDFANAITTRIGSGVDTIRKRLEVLEIPGLKNQQKKDNPEAQPGEGQNQGQMPSDTRSLDIATNARLIRQYALQRGQEIKEALQKVVLLPIEQVAPEFRKRVLDTSSKVQSSLKDFADRTRSSISSSGLGKVADEIRERFTEARGRLGDRAGRFVERQSAAISGIRDRLSGASEAIGAGIPESFRARITEVQERVSEGLTAASSIFESAGTRLVGLTKGLSDRLPAGIKEGTAEIKSRLSTGVEQVSAVIKSAWEKLPDTLQSLRENIPQEIQGRFSVVKERLGDGLKGIGDVLKFGGKELLKATQAIAGNFPDQIQKRIGQLRDSLFEGVKKLAGLFQQSEKKLTELIPTTAGAIAPADDLSANLTTRGAGGGTESTKTLDNRSTPQPPSVVPFEEYRQKIFDVLDAVDRRIISTSKIVGELPTKVSTALDLVSQPAAALAGINEPREVFEELKGVVGTVSEKIGEASQQIFFFTSAFDSLQALVANGPYQMLVGQNVELRKQLLQTQSSLVATNKILRDGQEIADPTAAIQALDAPVNAAITKIRRDSLELVGVTSKDLVGIFNTINQSASQANISLGQSADLTSSFAAALGTIGLPLNQASQEINSILTAQIDQNSVLAKTLSLDNERVRQLAQQGKLYDFLTEKLQAFRAGNALAAKTIEGVSSNIQEVFDNITLEAGAQLIEPIVEQLNRFYTSLNDNKSFLTDYITGLVAGLKTVGLAIASIIESFGENLGGVALQIPEYLFKELVAGAQGLAESIDFVLSVFRPFFDLISMSAQFIVPNLASPLLKVAVTLKLVSGTVAGLHRAFKTLMQLLPGLGQLLFFITLRTAPMVQQFVNLRSETGNLRVAFGLLLGKELTNIPGAMAAITSRLGIFGGTIAPLIPQVSQFAIAMIGLNKQFGITKNLPVAGIFKEISGAISGGLLPSLAQVARSKGLAQLADQVDGLAAKTAAVASPAALIDAVSGKVGNALGIDTTTKKVSALQAAVNNVSTTIGSKLLPAFSSVAKFAGFKKIANQADALAESVLNSVKKGAEMSKFDQVVDGVTQNIGKSVAKSTMMIVGWTAAISAAVIVIVELWKRSEDAGDQVRKLSMEMSATAELIRTTWDQTKKNVDQSLIKEENIIPPKDWIDSAILGIREIETTFYDAAAAINKNPFDFEASTKSFKELFAEVKTFKDFSLIVVKSIGALITLIGRLSTAFGEAVFGIGKGFMTLLIGLSKALTTFFKNPLDTKALGDAFNELGESIKGVFSDTLKNIGDNFQKIETKGEKSFREIGEDLRSGELDKAIADVGGSLEQMQKQIDSVKGGSGALFSQALAPVDAAIERLKNGTGTVKEVKDAIASVGQSFPELQKDLQGLSTQLGVEFPGEVITASKSIQGLEESLGKMKTDGKAVGGIQEVVENFKAGKATISDVLGEIDKYRNSLDENNFEGRKEAAGLAAPIDALQKSLDSLDAGASNRKLADIRASVDKDIEATDKLLKDREAQGRLGLTDAETSRLRERKAKLEAYRDQLEAIAEAVKAQADPFSKMESELNNAKTQIEKAMGDISNAQKESIAKIRVAQNANLDMDTGKERILSDSQARIEILKQETAAIQKEIPARYEALQKLLKLWNEMTPEEQESTRGKDLKRQMDAEQAALYEASANGAEKRAELEKAIAEKSISDIDRANKVALEKAQQAESERLVMLTQMRSQGLITAEEFEKQKADASVATAKKELEEQQKVLKSLEELPKPNDPDEAREREERIRAEKLKTSQATLKLIEAENAAYEAQTRKILAEIERRNDIIRAGLERRGRSGEITDSEKAEKEAALELKRLRAELAREKDANKRAELQLQLEKAKTSLQNARRQKEQEEFDRKLSEAEAAQLQAQREGGIDAEKAYTAVLERRLAAARRAVAIAKDANEKAKAQLELQRVLNDLEVDRIDRNLKAIENSYKRQNNSLQTQVKLFELAERSLANQKELIDAGNQLRASIGEYYDQTLGALSSLEKSDYRRRQLAEVTATIKLQAAIQEVKIAEQTLAIEQQMKRLALEREKIQARIAENEKLGNIKRLEAEEKKARIKGVSPEELEAIRIERKAAEEDYQLAQQSTALIDQQVAAQEDIFLIQQKIQQMQSKGKVEGAAANLIQNMADPGNQFNASEAFKEYLSQQLGAGSYSQLREGGLQSARNFQDQFFGQGFSRAGLQRDFFDIGKSLRDSQNQSFIATLPGASQRAIRPTTETRFGDSWSAASSPEARDLAAKYYSSSGMDKPQVPQIAPAGDLGEITGYVRGIFERMTTSESARPASKGGVEVTIQSLTVSGNISSSGSVDSGFSTNFRRELEKVFNEAARQSLV